MFDDLWAQHQQFPSAGSSVFSFDKVWSDYLLFPHKIKVRSVSETKYRVKLKELQEGAFVQIAILYLHLHLYYSATDGIR